MIEITTVINEEEDQALIIGFSAKDQEGCTKMEGDVADVFRKVLTATRDRIIEKAGFGSEEILANIYKRSFSDPEDRDSHSTREYVDQNLAPDIKKRANELLERDRTMMSSIVQASFLAGMQLCIRLCRNRASDCERTGQEDKRQEALVCEGIIRITQVEIGAGRMARPQFTKEELEEMDRIS